MTKYGYARISTTSQSTKEQIKQLLENDVEKKNIFSENLQVQNGIGQSSISFWLVSSLETKSSL